ncbi:hypothetical protein RDV78_07015 [Bacillota bacterium LX-D]|nr:hypothetical protein [Bacillota bacterium LX-D]
MIRLIVRSLLHRKAQSLATILAVSVGIALLLFVAVLRQGLFQGLEEQAGKLLKEFGLGEKLYHKPQELSLAKSAE